jgi:RecA-family ATPase
MWRRKTSFWSGFLDERDEILTLKMDRLPAYLGGDSNSQKDVSHFMRELLNPLLQRHQVGMILAHHTDKPFRGKKKDHWEAGDYAYLGASSPLDRFLESDVITGAPVRSLDALKTPDKVEAQMRIT